MWSASGRNAQTIAVAAYAPSSTLPAAVRAKVPIISRLRRRGSVMHCYVDLPPLSLIEPPDAQGAAGEVADEDREPDVDRLERRRLLDEEADAERDDDLRGDRDV